MYYAYASVPLYHNFYINYLLYIELFSVKNCHID